MKKIKDYEDIKVNDYYIMSDGKGHPDNEAIYISECIRYDSDSDEFTFKDLFILKEDNYGQGLSPDWNLDKDTFKESWTLKKITKKKNPEYFL